MKLGGTAGVNLDSSKFAPLNVDNIISNAQSRCDEALSRAGIKDRSHLNRVSDFLKWGAKLDSTGRGILPIENKNFRSKSDSAERDRHFIQSVMRNDQEYVNYLLKKAYQNVGDGSRLDNYINASGIRLDSPASVYFARELEYFEAVARDVLYPGANYNQIMSINSSAGGGAERVTFTSYDIQGEPLVTNGNSNVSNLVSITGDQFSYPVYSIKLAFQKTFQEIRSAIFANKPFDAMLAKTCRMLVEQQIDQFAFLGEPVNQLPGLFSIPGATALPASTTTGGATTWAEKISAGEQGAVQSDLLSIVQTIINGSKGTQAPDTLVLPIDVYVLLFGTPRSDNSDTTIGSYFMQNNPSVTRVFWSQWASQAASDNGVSVNACAMLDSSPDRINVLIPMPYTQYAPTIEGTAYRVETETRYAGVECYYANSVAYMVGI